MCCTAVMAVFIFVYKVQDLLAFYVGEKTGVHCPVHLYGC